MTAKLTLFAAVVWIHSAAFVWAADVNGVWTKTTSPDPNNIAIFYSEKSEVKAIGYSEIARQKVVWYASGEIKQTRLQLLYHHHFEVNHNYIRYYNTHLR